MKEYVNFVPDDSPLPLVSVSVRRLVCCSFHHACNKSPQKCGFRSRTSCARSRSRFSDLLLRSLLGPNLNLTSYARCHACKCGRLTRRVRNLKVVVFSFFPLAWNLDVLTPDGNPQMETLRLNKSKERTDVLLSITRTKGQTSINVT